MDNSSLKLLNYFFFAFHTFLIIFNLFGWTWKTTRRLNLLTLLLTAFSWVILGIWYGWGYCFLTDWHYEVLEKLGKTNLPNSYIAFPFKTITGNVPNVELVNVLTVVFFVVALICSVVVNLKYTKH